MKSRSETRAYHEKIAEDRFTAYELTDSGNFDDRQKARNILRYQMRGYCFELPPVCARYGKHCLFCVHVKCRENEQYYGEKWDHEFDPDINRFASVFDNLQGLAKKETTDDRRQTAAEENVCQNEPPKTDTERSLNSLLAALADGAKYTIV